MLIKVAAAILCCLVSCESARAETLSNFPLNSAVPVITFLSADGKSFSISPYLEKNRIILVFIPEELSRDAAGYLSHLSKLTGALSERDLKVFAIVDPNSTLLKNDYGADIKVVSQSDHLTTSSSGNEESAPRFILIGKDKLVKLNEKQFVGDKALFAVIDAMPMRKAEMRAKKTAK